MIIGRIRSGATPTDLTVDRVRVTDVEITEAANLSHLAAYLDGGGPNAGVALIRGVIFNADDELIARSDEVAIPGGSPAQWVQFAFPTEAGRTFAAGNYAIGLHIGGVTDCARTYVDDPDDAGSRELTDTYADGTAATLSSPSPLTASLPVFLSVFQPWTTPQTDDLALSRLPWDLTQRIFSASGALRASRTTAIAGWHGTALDEEPGAVAIVRSDGPLAGLVGERVRVTRRSGTLERSVALYVHDEQDFPDELASEDISLAKTAFLRLAPWPTEALDVIVEVLA